MPKHAAESRHRFRYQVDDAVDRSGSVLSVQLQDEGVGVLECLLKQREEEEELRRESHCSMAGSPRKEARLRRRTAIPRLEGSLAWEYLGVRREGREKGRGDGGEVGGDGGRGEKGKTLQFGALDDDVDGGSGDNGEVE